MTSKVNTTIVAQRVRSSCKPACLICFAVVLGVLAGSFIPCPRPEPVSDLAQLPYSAYDHMLVSLPSPRNISVPDEGLTFRYTLYMGTNSPRDILILEYIKDTSDATARDREMPPALHESDDFRSTTFRLSRQEAQDALAILQEMQFFEWPSMPYKTGSHPTWEEIVVHTADRSHKVIIGALPYFDGVSSELAPENGQYVIEPTDDRLRTLAKQFGRLVARMRRLGLNSRRQQQGSQPNSPQMNQ